MGDARAAGAVTLLRRTPVALAEESLCRGQVKAASCKAPQAGTRLCCAALIVALHAGGAAAALAQQATAGTPADTARPAALALQGVTLIDVRTGRRVPRQTIVVVGNRIRAVDARSRVRVPKGARIVQAPGTYVIPGLWDMHIHPTLPIDGGSTTSDRFPTGVYNQLIANGVTGIRDASSGVPLAELRRWKRAIVAHTLVAPRMVVSGPAIDEANAGDSVGPAGSYHLGVPPASARRVVDSLHAAGADMIKTYSMSPEMYFAVAAEARRLGIPFAGHLPTGGTEVWQVDGRHASDSGARILDHWSYFYPAVCGGGSSYGGIGYGANDTSAARCAAAGERLRRNGTWIADMMFLWPGDLARWSDSARAAFRQRAMRYAGPAVPGFYAGSRADAQWNSVVWRPLTAAERRRLPSTADWAREAGVDSSTGRPDDCDDTVYPADFPLLANTDFPAGGGPAGAMIHGYLLTKVLCGMPVLAALQTATLNPARALHATDSLGTIEVGKLADLVLLEGDPLTDIWNVTKIRAVVADGRYFDRAALDRLLVEAAADYRSDLDRRKAAQERLRENP